MTPRQKLLCLNPTVGNDAHQGWHEQGNDPLHGIEITYLVAHSGLEQIGPHRNKVGSPHGKLQETHTYQTRFHIAQSLFHLYKYLQ